MNPPSIPPQDDLNSALDSTSRLRPNLRPILDAPIHHRGKRRAATVLAVSILGLAALPAGAHVGQKFDGAGTNYSPAASGGATPSVQSGALRFLNGTTFTRTSIGFPADADQQGSFFIEFDFRLSGGSATPADGFGMALLNTATHGVSGAAPLGGAGWEWERPRIPAAFAVGFDIYGTAGATTDLANEVSLNWNGAQRATRAVSAMALKNDVWNRARVEIHRRGADSEVTVALTPDITSATPGAPFHLYHHERVAGLVLSGSYRLAIGGRTGGQTVALDVDNIRSAAFAERFVSPTGDDAKDGLSSANAVKTLERARTLAQNFRPTQDRPLIVWLAPGRYERSTVFTLGNADGGANGYDIIWSGVNAPETGPASVITGADRFAVSGWQQVLSGGVPTGKWSAPVARTNFRALYVNGRLAERARTRENVKLERFEKEVGSVPATRLATIDPKSAPAISAASAAQVEIRVRDTWHDFMVAAKAVVSGVDENYAEPRLTLRVNGTVWNDDGAGQLAFTPYAGSEAYLENAIEFLDDPGEYVADAASGRVHYIPRASEVANFPASITAVVPASLTTLFRITGTSDADRARQLTVRRVSFEESDWLSPNGVGFANVQGNHIQRPVTDNGNNNGQIPAVLRVQNADEIGLIDSRFTRLSGTAVHLRIGVLGAFVQGNTFVENAGDAFTTGRETSSRNRSEAPGRVRFSDNMLYRQGNYYRGAIAIDSFNLRESEIVHNHLQDMPYSGMQIGFFDYDLGDTNGNGNIDREERRNNSYGNLVARNRVINTLKHARDGAPIYSISSQRLSATEIQRTTMSGNFLVDWWTDQAALYCDQTGANHDYLSNVSEQRLNLAAPPHTAINTFWQWLFIWADTSYGFRFAPEGQTGNTNWSTTGLRGDYRPGDKTTNPLPVVNEYALPARDAVTGVVTLNSGRPATAQAIANAAGIRAPYASLLSGLPSATANAAPVVSGLPTTATVGLLQPLTFTAAVKDDGLPYDRLVFEWDQTAAPTGGLVTFSNSERRQTRVAFNRAGAYTLRFRAQDGALTTTQTIAVTVQAASLGLNRAAGILPTVTSTLVGAATRITDGSYDGSYPNFGWVSKSDGGVNQSFTIDLGQARRPLRFILSARDGNRNERSNFQVLASNDPTFASFIYLADHEDVPFRNYGRWTADPVTDTAFRYFRVQGRYEGKGFAAAEFELYAHAGQPAPSLASGSYGPGQTVTFTVPTAGATVRYTLDGSTPSETNGALYTPGSSTPVAIPSTSTVTLKAVSVAANFGVSPVATRTYRPL